MQSFNKCTLSIKAEDKVFVSNFLETPAFILKSNVEDCEKFISLIQVPPAEESLKQTLARKIISVFDKSHYPIWAIPFIDQILMSPSHKRQLREEFLKICEIGSDDQLLTALPPILSNFSIDELKNYKEKNPIHFAMSNVNLSPEIFIKLMEVFPNSLKEKDEDGRLPLDDIDLKCETAGKRILACIFKDPLKTSFSNLEYSQIFEHLVLIKERAKLQEWTVKLCKDFKIETLNDLTFLQPALMLAIRQDSKVSCGNFVHLIGLITRVPKFYIALKTVPSLIPFIPIFAMTPPKTELDFKRPILQSCLKEFKVNSSTPIFYIGQVNIKISTSDNTENLKTYLKLIDIKDISSLMQFLNLLFEIFDEKDQVHDILKEYIQEKVFKVSQTSDQLSFDYLNRFIHLNFWVLSKTKSLSKHKQLYLNYIASHLATVSKLNNYFYARNKAPIDYLFLIIPETYINYISQRNIKDPGFDKLTHIYCICNSWSKIYKDFPDHPNYNSKFILKILTPFFPIRFSTPQGQEMKNKIEEIFHLAKSFPENEEILKLLYSSLPYTDEFKRSLLQKKETLDDLRLAEILLENQINHALLLPLALDFSNTGNLKPAEIAEHLKKLFAIACLSNPQINEHLRLPVAFQTDVVLQVLLARLGKFFYEFCVSENSKKSGNSSFLKIEEQAIRFLLKDTDKIDEHIDNLKAYLSGACGFTLSIVCDLDDKAPNLIKTVEALKLAKRLNIIPMDVSLCFRESRYKAISKGTLLESTLFQLENGQLSKVGCKNNPLALSRYNNLIGHFDWNINCAAIESKNIPNLKFIITRYPKDNYFIVSMIYQNKKTVAFKGSISLPQIKNLIYQNEKTIISDAIVKDYKGYTEGLDRPELVAVLNFGVKIWISEHFIQVFTMTPGMMEMEVKKFLFTDLFEDPISISKYIEMSYQRIDEFYKELSHKFKNVYFLDLEKVIPENLNLYGIFVDPNNGQVKFFDVNYISDINSTLKAANYIKLNEAVEKLKKKEVEIKTAEDLLKWVTDHNGKSFDLTCKLPMFNLINIVVEALDKAPVANLGFVKRYSANQKKALFIYFKDKYLQCHPVRVVQECVLEDYQNILNTMTEIESYMKGMKLSFSASIWPVKIATTLSQEAAAPEEMTQLLNVLDSLRAKPWFKTNVEGKPHSFEELKNRLSLFVQCFTNKREIAGWSPTNAKQTEAKNIFIKNSLILLKNLLKSENKETLESYVIDLAKEGNYCNAKLTEIYHHFHRLLSGLDPKETLKEDVQEVLSKIYAHTFYETLDDLVFFMGDTTSSGAEQSIHVVSYLKRILFHRGYSIPVDPATGLVDTGTMDIYLSGKEDYPEQFIETIFKSIFFKKFIDKFKLTQVEMVNQSNWEYLGDLKNLLIARIEYMFKNNLIEDKVEYRRYVKARFNSIIKRHQAKAKVKVLEECLSLHEIHHKRKNIDNERFIAAHNNSKKELDKLCEESDRLNRIINETQLKLKEAKSKDSESFHVSDDSKKRPLEESFADNEHHLKELQDKLIKLCSKLEDIEDMKSDIRHRDQMTDQLMLEARGELSFIKKGEKIALKLSQAKTNLKSLKENPDLKAFFEDYAFRNHFLYEDESCGFSLLTLKGLCHVLIQKGVIVNL